MAAASAASRIEDREKGCVAHIVRLAENQRFSKIDPRGVDFRIYLIINETNNVCNAPFLLRRGIPHPFSDKEKANQLFIN